MVGKARIELAYDCFLYNCVYRSISLFQHSKGEGTKSFCLFTTSPIFSKNIIKRQRPGLCVSGPLSFEFYFVQLMSMPGPLLNNSTNNTRRRTEEVMLDMFFICFFCLNSPKFCFLELFYDANIEKFPRIPKLFLRETFRDCFDY